MQESCFSYFKVDKQTNIQTNNEHTTQQRYKKRRVNIHRKADDLTSIAHFIIWRPPGPNFSNTNARVKIVIENSRSTHVGQVIRILMQF